MSRAEQTGSRDVEPIIPLDSNGQEFAEQISLERVGENEFKSANLPCPGGRRVIQGKSYVTTFGGHVYAQSAWAAAQTVPGGFVIHNVAGFFTSVALSSHLFHFAVSTVSDSRSYSTRTVMVTQPTSPLSSVCFTATVSFKKPEPDSSAALSYQDTSVQTPSTRFSTILGGRHPCDLPEKRYNDMVQVLADRSPEPHRSCSFRGIQWVQLPYAQKEITRSPDPGHADIRPARRRSANMYTVQGPLAKFDVNLHICVHLLASDREIIFLVARHLGVRSFISAVSSLGHTVVMHELGEDVTFFRKRGAEQKWFCQEVWTDRWSDGRVVIHGKICDIDTGKHIATTTQDAILKVDLGGDEEVIGAFKEQLRKGAAVGTVMARI